MKQLIERTDLAEAKVLEIPKHNDLVAIKANNLHGEIIGRVSSKPRKLDGGVGYAVQRWKKAEQGRVVTVVGDYVKTGVGKRSPQFEIKDVRVIGSMDKDGNVKVLDKRYEKRISESHETFKSYSESREDALVGFARCMEEGEEDIFTVLGPGTTLGEGGSGRSFDWKSVNRKIDRLGDHMMAELGDAFEGLDLHSSADDQDAAEKMKEYLEATFNEVRDRVEMYETNAITRSKKVARRRR